LFFLSLTHDTGLSNGCLILSRFKLEADPSTAQAAPANSQPQQSGEVLRGGARGAAAGAAIGAIAGNAGKGVSIGATVGGLRKGFQKIDNNRNAQSQPAVSSAGQNTYNRAIGACLSGRGYSVS
jgi:hypothetical protein